MANQPDQIRVVLVDDHTLLRDAVSDLLSAEPDIEVVGQAGDAAGAVAVVRRTQPDVVLLDLEIPGGRPEATTRRLLRGAPHSKVIVLSMHDDPELLRGMRDIGVRGYLHKSVSGQDLARAIRQVNGAAASPAVPGRGSGALSSREHEVLALVAAALSNRQIAGRLHITEGTVKRHLRNIFDKLGAVSRIDAVNKAATRANR